MKGRLDGYQVPTCDQIPGVQSINVLVLMDEFGRMQVVLWFRCNVTHRALQDYLPHKLVLLQRIQRAGTDKDCCFLDVDE